MNDAKRIRKVFRYGNPGTSKTHPEGIPVLPRYDIEVKGQLKEHKNAKASREEKT